MLLIIFIALAWGIRYAWVSFPLISGFDAKQVCTCVFVSNRSMEDLDTTEMSSFPFSLGSYKVNVGDSSVTSSVWGMATKKAILTAEQEAEIYAAYRSGTARTQIMQKFKISYLVFTQVLRNMIRKENEQDKPENQML